MWRRYSSIMFILGFTSVTWQLVVASPYTIGKLTCEYYPKHFERIIILCVQNKLIEGMNREIEKFIDQPGCLKLSEKLVIENNTEVILKAVRSGSLQNCWTKWDIR